MGRRKVPIDPKIVEIMARYHASVDEIAAEFGCHRDTIRNRFKDAMERGKQNACYRLRVMQWKSAERGNVTMQIFLGKQYLGQSDKTESKTDSQVTHKLSTLGDLSKMTGEQLAELWRKYNDS